VTLRGTLLLAGVLAGLAGYLRFTAPAPPQPESPALLPALERTTEVQIARGDTETRLVRGDGAWRAANADDLLDALESLRVLASIAHEPSDPTAYGFTPDAVRLRFLADGVPLAAIEVGASNPASTGVYVRRSGEPSVLLVGALLRWELEKLRRVFPATVPP
jgi:hypothetical protein